MSMSSIKKSLENAAPMMKMVTVDHIDKLINALQVTRKKMETEPLSFTLLKDTLIVLGIGEEEMKRFDDFMPDPNAPATIPSIQTILTTSQDEITDGVFKRFCVKPYSLNLETQLPERIHPLKFKIKLETDKDQYILKCTDHSLYSKKAVDFTYGDIIVNIKTI
ncbi:MAG: hypothetical protein N2B06_17205 [Clostridium sp.]